MLMLSSWVRVFVCREPTNMQRSFDGLCGLVRGVLQQDPLSGHLFCFFNRPRTYVKILAWDTNGYSLWAKRLTRGNFEVPAADEITRGELQQILEGIALGAPQRRRFSYQPQ